MINFQTPTTKASRSVRAFTLVEILIGIAIFLFVLLVLTTVVGGLAASSFRALAMKRLSDTTRTSLEIMGREMRLAQSNTGPCTGMGSDVFHIEAGGQRIKFKDFQNRCVVYDYVYNPDLNHKAIWKNVNDLTGTCSASSCEKFLGSGQITIDSAQFTVTASPRPRVTITMVVSTPDPSAPGQRLSVSLQTTVSKREL